MNEDVRVNPPDPEPVSGWKVVWVLTVSKCSRAESAVLKRSSEIPGVNAVEYADACKIR